MAKQVLLNFQQMRAEASVNAPTVIDKDGAVHAVEPFPLDSLLEMIELEETFDKAQDTAEVVRLFARIKDVILSIIPTFPVGKLTLDEVQKLVTVLIGNVQPDGAQPEAPRDAEGELTPPAG